MQAADLEGYAVREESRRDHLIELRAVYGYKMFTGRGARDLKAWLEAEAEAARSNEDLARRFVGEYRRTLTILPGVSVIERLFADALVAAERRIETHIAERLDARMRTKLDALLSKTVDGGISRFIWLRHFEVGKTSADMNRVLDRQDPGDHRLWEVAVLFHLREAFRSGDIRLTQPRAGHGDRGAICPADGPVLGCGCHRFQRRAVFPQPPAKVRR
jgi:Domain of unknown function (DUF4158)